MTVGEAGNKLPVSFSSKGFTAHQELNEKEKAVDQAHQLHLGQIYAVFTLAPKHL